MSRSLLLLILVAVVVIGGLFVLSGRDTAQTPKHIEKAVTLENLA